MRQEANSHTAEIRWIKPPSDPCRPCRSQATIARAALAIVSCALCGCQLMTSGPMPGARDSSAAARSFKPQTENSSPAAPTSGLTSATATIRGQSPVGTTGTNNGWNAGTAGGGNTLRQPMAASGTPIPPANSAGAVNRYQQQFAPTSTTPPPANFTAQGGTLPAPGTTPGALTGPGGLAPNTVLQPQVPNNQLPGGMGYGYGAAGPGVQPSPSDYGAAIAPGAVAGPGLGDTAILPGVLPYEDPMQGVTVPGANGFVPRRRIAPIDVFVQEARTGRIIVGGSVNSDLGVAANIVVDERNFNIRRLPRGWRNMWSDGSFRGGGQNFRLELMPGNRVERYTVSWTERNLLGYLPYSLSVGGFYFTRQFRDWTEQRLGGRVALGYEVTKDISVSSEIRMEDVKLFDARLAGVQELDDALGSNDIYRARFRLAHDTRDSPFMSSRGALLELVFDQVFGEYDYSRGGINYSRYFMVRERPDGTGRHTLASTWRVGITGSQTPIFENYFAGGFSTLRGFSFRGASPKVGDVQVGGELMFLGSLEYVFPITADEMLRGVAFVDYGTIERDLEINSENFRVAPGLGLRVSVPALGPAPLAFDFAYPINHADSDDRQVFSFSMGFTR